MMNPDTDTSAPAVQEKAAAARRPASRSAAPASRPATQAESCPTQPIPLRKELIDNLPYAAMILLGTAVFLAGLDHALWRWLLAGLYFAYGLAGAIWVMAFICPYCHFYDTRLCPCGYGRISPKFGTKKPNKSFAKQFKKHIPVIVPLWIIPPIAGGILLYLEFSIALLILLGVFMLNSFVILPQVSKRYGCAHCPQKDECPWMTRSRLFAKRQAATDD